MADINTDKIMSYLTPKRMSSIGNIAYAMNHTIAEVIPAILELEQLGKLRLARSRCSSDCGSCSSCESKENTNPQINERTIAISME